VGCSYSSTSASVVKPLQQIPSFSPWGVVEGHIIDSHLPAETSVENTCAAKDQEEESCCHMQD
jgi:hypothetical protein